MVRPDNQRPTWTNLPELISTDGPMAAKLAAEFFGEPLEWQRYVLDALLARDERDKYQFHSIGLAVPRQNGKSWDVLARCFYGIVADGERILYTCQHGDTSDEMFRRLSEPFEDEDNEELHGLLLAVRKTNGQQAIYLKNGGYIRFTTRTNSLARGRSYDVIIYDEAQELTEAQQAASLFAISASRKHNAQTIYLGTPPGPECLGEVFSRLHGEVHANAASLAWMEWAATEIGDVHDRKRWYRTNPSLGILIDESAVEGELTTAEDTFARERLGWWSARRAQAAMDGDSWAACATTDPPQSGIPSYGVKISFDGRSVALAVCLRPEGGLPHIEVVSLHSIARGTKRITDWLIDRARECAQVTIDGRAKADVIKKALREAGMPKRQVVVCEPADMANACAMLDEAVSAQGLTHFAQPGLDSSATTSTRRKIGNSGGWGFDGDDPLAIEACALAYWGAMTTKRRPGRKARLL